MSLIILLKPTTTIINCSSSYKFGKSNDNGHQIKRRTTLNGSFDYKLTSFYSYLTALSICDLFSCLFSVLNVLEHVQPPYLAHSSLKFREICLYISLYTHPIAITLQALSIWIICAFSMHRCRSIIKPSTFLYSVKNNKTADTNRSLFKLFSCDKLIRSEKKYFFQFKLRNNCNDEKFELKFYTRSISYLFKQLKCLYCFCSITESSTSNTRKRSFISNDNQTSSEDINDSKEIAKRYKTSPLLNKLNKARLNIILLYLLAILYLIPQLFEKRITLIEVENKTYLFAELTKFGQSKLFRQLFHLWFYLVSVYLIPFFLILTFNFILLRAFLNSKKRCQRYLIKKEQNDAILRENRSFSVNNIEELNPQTKLTNSKSNNLTVNNNTQTNISSISIETRENSTAKSVILADTSQELLKPEVNVTRSTTFRKQNSIKISNRSRSLTLTLFGVVCVFGVCHLPAAISKILYVLYPSYEFEYNNKNIINATTWSSTG